MRLGTNGLLFAVGLSLTLAHSAAATDDSGLQEIVVTATKQEENIQRVPVSVSAFSGDALKEQNISNVLDLQYLAPGLSVSTNNGSGFLYIRGVGSDIIGVGADPSVAFNLDGVYIGRPEAALTQFSDIERVEVLRGPQGTLYGRNATGGSVNIITKEPTKTFSSSADIEYGNYNRVEADGSISGPLSDSVTARLAVRHAQHDGFIKNELAGQPVQTELAAAPPGLEDPLAAQRGTRAPSALQDEEVSSLLGKIVWAAADNADLALHADFTHDNTNGPNLKSLAPVGLAFSLGATTPSDPYETQVNEGVFEDKKNGGVALIGHWDGGAFSAKSVTSYRHFTNDSLFDSDGTDVRAVDFLQHLSEDEYSQELQLSGKSSLVDWIAGAFYLYERSNWTGDVFAAFAPPFNTPPIPPGTNAPAYTIFQFRSYNNTRAPALFGQGTVHLTEKLSAIVGARFSHEEKVNYGSTPPFLPDVLRQQQSWNAWTPKFGFNLDLTDQVLLYVSAARGFKSGGFNSTPTSQSEEVPFNPEYLWAYEVGTKGTFLDGRLRVNASAFYYNYTNLQVFAYTGLASAVIVNAAKARNYGSELELTASPAKNFKVYFSTAYLNATYREFLATGAPVGVNGEVNLAGNSVRNSPRWSVNTAFEYTQPLPNGGDVALRATTDFKTTVYFDQYNSALLKQGDLALLNAQATYHFPDGKWSVALAGRNLTNRLYYTGGVAFAGLNYTPQVYVGDPRTYWVQASFKY